MSRLINELNQIVEEKNVLKHPFYVLWNEGRLTVEHLQNYSKQYYHLENTFPRFLSAMHARCPDLKTRQVILENLFEEELESTPHEKLWRQFQTGLGVPAANQTSTPQLPETQSALATLQDICANKSVEEGLAAMYAYEVMIPAVAETKVKGLAEHYGITDEEATAFFTVHGVADVKHAQAWADLLKKFEGDAEKEARLRQAVHDACDALNKFLDGVMRAYVKDLAC